MTEVLYVNVVLKSLCSVTDLMFSLFFQPLNPNPDSRWNTYFKDNEILLQIDKDVRCVVPQERPYSCNCWLSCQKLPSASLLSLRAGLCRRLYPDMAFFQRPTEYPCQLILDPQNDYETLRRRVEQTTLKAQTVNRNRSGVTNVSLAAAA